MRADAKRRTIQILESVISVVFGIAAALLAVQLIGDSPAVVAQVLFKSAFGSREDFGWTLYYTTPLIFSGLSVMMALRAGLFNIGGEGQLLWGAMGAVIVGLQFQGLSPLFGSVACILGALLLGGLWGFIPGYLRAKRGSHEVILTIMLNFIAAGLTSYLTLDWFKSTENQNPETASIPAQYMLTRFTTFGDTPLNVSFVLAIVAVVLCWVFLWKTKTGYSIRAVGENPVAARQHGIRSDHAQIIAMTLAGSLAAMAGVNEILGSAGKFRMGFSADLGFLGIAVALLGRKRPTGVLLAAFLFGALQKGTTDLDVETEKVTRDFSQVLQALIILSVSCSWIWNSWLKKWIGGAEWKRS